MAFYQGSLDGLCGQYAIANALEQCGFTDEDYFQTACRGLARRRWPDVLWEGTTIGDLQKMIAHCQLVHDELQHVNIAYPFRKAAPKSNRSYWERFDGIFEDEAVRCAVVGLEKPDPHWIVVYRDGRRLQFVDSNPFGAQIRKNRASVFAGERRQSKNQWLVNRRKLIPFRR